jgi:hypothetical protein
MIEPQNTVMPHAAPSTPVDAPHGDATFGEMLAQSLGMIPRLESSAIAAVSSDQTGGEQSADVGTDVEPEEDDKHLDRNQSGGEQVFVGIVPTRRFSIVRAGGDGPIVSDPVIVDEPIEPVAPTQPVIPVLGPSRGEQEPTLPVVGPEAVDQGEPADPVDTAVGGEPAVNHAGTPISTPAYAPTQASDRSPVETVLPGAVPGDVVPPVSGDGDVFEKMPEIKDPVPAPQDGDLHFEQTPVETVVRPDSPSKPGPSMPTPPAPPGSDQVPGSRVETVTTPTVYLTERSVLSIEDAAVALGETASVRLTDGKVTIEPAASNGTEVVASLSPEGASRNTTTAVSAFSSPAASAQHTALAERVLEAVQLQANQPPPRTMIVDIPEIEGLRLVVSVRAGAEVHVVPTSGSTVGSGLQPFMSELENVLANRGFTMTGDGRRRNGNEYEPEEEEMPRRSRPTLNRPTDNDLRI